MRRIIRKFIPNTLVNYGKHLPWAILANLRYNFPSKKMIVVGITGTDGKTTTTNMVYQILKNAGKKVSMISTINAVIAGKSYDTGFHVTSPNPFELHRLINVAKKHGDQYLVLEVTSHAIDQFRVLGIKFDVGVITNVTHEHLDYHKTFENYLKAKSKLIENARVAVINRDEKHFEKLSSTTNGQIISFGLSKSADFNPYKFPLKLVLPGDFNLANAMAASAASYVLGIDAQTIKKTLSEFAPIPGRMEKIKNDLGLNIYIDFAHTPNGLEQALKTLRGLTTKDKRLIAVFGCASERDAQKRPLMGRISGKLADLTILTDEDPRFENSMKILDEIAQGVISAGGRINKNLYKEPNRLKAIKLAIKLSQRGDTIGIFGKGHEKSMNYLGLEKPWSDQEAVKKVLYG